MNFVLKKQKNKNMWISGFMSIKKKGFASLYINIFLTCPFRQLTKKSTCSTQSFSCPKKLIKTRGSQEPVGVETRLKGYKYFEIERDFFNKLVLIDGDFKFGVLLLVFVRFLDGDTGNLYRNGFL